MGKKVKVTMVDSAMLHKANKCNELINKLKTYLTHMEEAKIDIEEQFPNVLRETLPNYASGDYFETYMLYRAKWAEHEGIMDDNAATTISNLEQKIDELETMLKDFQSKIYYDVWVDEDDGG